MSHLGTQVSALVDGQLPPQAAERALAHVAGCAECAAALAAARQARAALAGAGDVPCSPDLARRLLALGSVAPVPAAARLDPAAAGSLPLPGPAGPRLPGGGCLRGDVVPGRGRQVRVAAAVSTGVVVLAVLLFAAGDLPRVVPSGHPAQALTLLGRAEAAAAAADARGAVVGVVGEDVDDDGAGQAVMVLPAAETPHASTGAPDLDAPEADGDAVAWIRAQGWGVPRTVPASHHVVGLRDVPGAVGALEVDLASADGTAVVLQQRGRLDVDALDAVPTTVAGRTVHVLGHAPWQAVWQCGDVVVHVVADDPGAAEDLLAAYPVAEPDERVTARIARGWRAVAGAWAP